MADIWKKGPLYGYTNYGQGEKVLVEFVSANPTGPLNVGKRQGSLQGDCLASILTACGYETSREYYVNDAGRQVVLALSLEARYRRFLGQDAQVPEGGYRGNTLSTWPGNWFQSTEIACLIWQMKIDVNGSWITLCQP